MHAGHAQVVEAVVAKVGAHRTGIRLSPWGTFLQDALDEDAGELTLHLIEQLKQLGLLYLHCIEARAAGQHDVEPPPGQDLLGFRKAWPVSGLIMIASMHNPARFMLATFEALKSCPEGMATKRP